MKGKVAEAWKWQLTSD